MKRRIVLLGPPASGKGSQAHMISRKYGIPAVSTGHLLRDEAAAGTELGRMAAGYTSKGQFAPDDLVLAVLKDWLKGGRDSFIFDGFPRTLAQAERLEPLLASTKTPIEIVLHLDCGLATIEDRVLNRVNCPKCHSIFKIGVHFGSETTICPNCGGTLTRRSDDTPEILAQRMVQHAEKTEPLIAFYEKRELLHHIQAEREIDLVFADIDAAICA